MTYKEPFSKESLTLRCWGLGLEHTDLGDTTQPIAVKAGAVPGNLSAAETQLRPYTFRLWQTVHEVVRRRWHVEIAGVHGVLLSRAVRSRPGVRLRPRLSSTSCKEPGAQ